MTEQAQQRQNARRKARPYRQLGYALRRARGELTQEAAAERAGVSVSFVSQCELGYYCPSIPLLCKLAAAYGTTISAMLEGIQ